MSCDKIALLACSPIPLGMLVGYFIMRKPNTAQSNPSSTVPQDPDEKATASVKSGNEPKAKEILSGKTKLWLIFKLLKYTIPLFFVYFGEYVINQGISPVLTFPNSSVFAAPYVYYQFIYQSGVFISRSSVNFVPLRQVWPPATLQMVNAVFLATVAVWNFVPSVWIVFLIIFWEGLLGGSVYVNSFYLISSEFEEKFLEFCMGATSMGYALGITFSALAGYFLQPFLAQLRCDTVGICPIETLTGLS